MIKVAFYISNKAICKVDCGHLGDTNPGIGGTEFLILSTSYKLGIQYAESLQVLLLTEVDGIYPSGLNAITVGSKRFAIEFANKESVDILVLKYEESDFVNRIFDCSSKTKLVIWAHNIIPNHILREIFQKASIRVVVNVGREQLDLYRDSKAFLKSTYIYNSISIKPKNYYINHSVPFLFRKKEVTYLGSLIPVKGFHILAKVWPEIIKACPDAHLNVIGSGRVYNEDSKLGCYGIADESYEREFMPYLVDSEGNILSSVTFWGKLGEEKNDILGRTKVGVPNPSGLSETFCLSAVEMELYQCRIVTKKYVGFLDTVPRCAGTLIENESNLAAAIIQELQIDQYDFSSTYDYVFSLFDENVIYNQWNDLFKGIVNNQSITHDSIISNTQYNYKNWREINRKVKSSLPGGYLFPTIDTLFVLLNKIFRCKFKQLY